MDSFSAASIITDHLLIKVLAANPRTKYHMEKLAVPQYLTTAAKSKDPMGDSNRIALKATVILPVHPVGQPDKVKAVRFFVCSAKLNAIVLGYEDAAMHRIHVVPSDNVAMWEGTTLPIVSKCRVKKMEQLRVAHALVSDRKAQQEAFQRKQTRKQNRKAARRKVYRQKLKAAGVRKRKTPLHKLSLGQFNRLVAEQNRQLTTEEMARRQAKGTAEMKRLFGPKSAMKRVASRPVRDEGNDTRTRNVRWEHAQIRTYNPNDQWSPLVDSGPMIAQ